MAARSKRTNKSRSPRKPKRATAAKKATRSKGVAASVSARRKAKSAPKRAASAAGKARAPVSGKVRKTIKRARPRPAQPAAKPAATREDFFDAAAEEQIKAVLAALARSRSLDPSTADYMAPSDVVAVESDGGLIGGNPIGYFFRSWPDLAAARWLARTDLEEVDLRAAYKTIMKGDDDDEGGPDAEDLAGVFLGQLAGEETVFEGTIEQLCSGEEGAELRALWRDHLEMDEDLDDENDAAVELDSPTAGPEARLPIDPPERDVFFAFLRSGGL